VVKGRCSRPQIHDPQGAGHHDCEGAQANRRSDTSKGYRDRLVAQTRPPGASIRKERPRQSKSQSRRLRSQHGAIRRSLHHCFLLRSAATPPIARLVMSKRPESFIPWPLAHPPRPVAFAPRQSSSLSRAPPVGRAAYSSEHAFAQTVQPNTGLHLAHEGRTV